MVCSKEVNDARPPGAVSVSGELRQEAVQPGTRVTQGRKDVRPRKGLTGHRELWRRQYLRITDEKGFMG